MGTQSPFLGHTTFQGVQGSMATCRPANEHGRGSPRAPAAPGAVTP